MLFNAVSTIWGRSRRTLTLLVILAISFNSASACENCEENADVIGLNYRGAAYLSVSVSAQDELLFNRKLVPKQGFSLPLKNAKGKKYRQFSVRVGARELVLKLACSSKQVAQNLGADVFTLSYDSEVFKKPPCFVKDDGTAVNQPVLS